MAHDEIMKLEAGRELDAMIHTKVMNRTYRVSDGNMDLLYDFGDYADEGECIDTSNHGGKYHVRQQRIPEYSTDIAAAWQVVEKFAHTSRNGTAKKMQFSHFQITAYPNGSWSCLLGCDNMPTVSTHAPTAPLAICRAALLEALGEPQL